LSIAALTFLVLVVVLLVILLAISAGHLVLDVTRDILDLFARIRQDVGMRLHLDSSVGYRVRKRAAWLVGVWVGWGYLNGLGSPCPFKLNDELPMQALATSSKKNIDHFMLLLSNRTIWIGN
jgi:hypothetical protein